ncbi:UNVERIFIED_CONTAM: hypothetical protein GTU68_005270 [Idotea baltica]|nr:hypothetical protein [Idotea baltica]
MAILQVRNVSKRFGGLQALNDVNLSVEEGTVHAIIGPNGAGKSTLLNCFVGRLTPDTGTVMFNGKSLLGIMPHEINQAGVGLVPEDRRIIPGLTVHENLELAQIVEPKGWPIELLYERFPRLAERRKQEAVTMSGGEQQMLAVARAMARDVKLLLLDEPYEGLAPVIVHEIERIVREIKDAGITTIIVEQNAVAALKLADRAAILDTGEVVFDGTAQEVLDNVELREKYLAI